jgi:hypothetical protein
MEPKSIPKHTKIVYQNSSQTHEVHKVVGGGVMDDVREGCPMLGQHEY